jgi:hypothetical protein
VVKIEKPQVARQGELIWVKDPSDIDRAATRLVEFLRERQLITPKD